MIGPINFKSIPSQSEVSTLSGNAKMLEKTIGLLFEVFSKNNTVNTETRTYEEIVNIGSFKGVEVVKSDCVMQITIQLTDGFMLCAKVSGNDVIVTTQNNARAEWTGLFAHPTDDNTKAGRKKIGFISRFIETAGVLMKKRFGENTDKIFNDFVNDINPDDEVSEDVTKEEEIILAKLDKAVKSVN